MSDLCHFSSSSTLDDLREALTRAGCFKKAPWRSVLELMLNLGFAGSCFVFSQGCGSIFLAVPAFLLGSFFFYRTGWLMHDAAHGGTFRSAAGNRRFATLTAGLLGEFPSGWRYGHNRHHAAPNVQGRDMDQRERWDPARRYRSRTRAWLGLFAFTRIRGVYFPATLIFLGLRDGYFCWRYKPERFVFEVSVVLLSLAAQLLFFCWLSGSALAGSLLFFAHTHIGMLYLNSAFAGNHYDMATFTPEQADAMDVETLQALTTRNYAGGWWTHYLFGGLEKQLEHHLFPHLPTHQVTRASPIVRSYLQARGLPYHELGFVQSLGRVLDFHVDRR